jgi:hypothetical protein
MWFHDAAPIKMISKSKIRSQKFRGRFDLPPLAVPVDWQEVRLQG